MPRSVNSVASRARRKKILKRTRGYWGKRKNVWTIAKNVYEKGQTYAYRGRKDKKIVYRRVRDFLQVLNEEQLTRLRNLAIGVSDNTTFTEEEIRELEWKYNERRIFNSRKY